MALKIVHLCDVHSTKGEDVPAAFAHTLVLDGGTYAIDLCKPCDDERFTPLAAFMDAFGLLTEGTVDPREAVAENLRAIVRQESPQASPVAPVKAPPVRAQAPAPVRAPEPVLAAPVSVEPEAHDAHILRLLQGAPDGLSAAELAAATGLSVGSVSTYTSPLRTEGKVAFVARRWWAPENVPKDLQESLAKRRDIVHARDAIPRVCIVDAEAFPTTQLWDAHCQSVHGVKPSELLGLSCPLDGEEFGTPQLLGMHGRLAHNCSHTPQLFNLAADNGDPVGIIADIRARYPA